MIVALFLTMACTGGSDSVGGDETDADTDADSDSDSDADSDTDTDTDPGSDGDKDGYTADVDCDDTDPAIHPDAKETCGNDVDDNCDGESNGCDWSGTIALGGIELFDNETNAYAAREVAVCDLNGDGQLDVILGAAGAAAPFGSAGAVYAFFGPIAADTNTKVADMTLAGGDAGAWTGWAIDCSGDVDGDGLADVVVGAPGQMARAGDVYLVPGGTTGATEIADAAVGHWTGEYDHDYLGTDVETLDSNGDGLTDFAVGRGSTPDEATQYGGAYLWLGPASGVDTADVAPVRIYGEYGSAFYSVVGSAGDVDADGDDELLVQAPIPKSSNYALVMFEGPLSGGLTMSDADATIADNTEQGFGSSSSGITHADLNGDGFGDLVASNTRHDSNAGASYVFFGDIDGDTSTAVADAKIYGNTDDQVTGCALTSPGDVDGDGADDLVVTGCLDSLGGKYSGTVFLLYSPFAGNMELVKDAQAEWFGTDYKGGAGYDVAAGEVTADGVVDLVVGVPWADGGKAVILSSWDL
jgi:hypothetical protein